MLDRGVARINEKNRHKLFRRGVCVALKVGGAKEGTPWHSRAIQHEIQIILSLFDNTTTDQPEL